MDWSGCARCVRRTAAWIGLAVRGVYTARASSFAACSRGPGAEGLVAHPVDATECTAAPWLDNALESLQNGTEESAGAEVSCSEGRGGFW